MKLNSRYKYFFVILATTSLQLSGCSFFPESSFELAPESRLPRWFALPPELSRSEVTVTMSYYLRSSGHEVTFTLFDTKKHKLMYMEGKHKDLRPLTLKIPARGFPARLSCL